MKYTIIILAVLLLTAMSAHAQVVVIAHKSVQASSMSSAQVSNIFTMSTREWPNGEKVTVFDQKEEAARKKFFSYIRKSPVEVKKLWLRMQLSGEGKAPETLNSDDDVIQKVVSTPGAIGYVHADKVSNDVKVIATIN